MIRKAMRWLGVVVVLAAIGIQFARPERTNPASDDGLAIGHHVNVSPEAERILDRACNDCHSNQTRWPWYSGVAPVSWYVVGHVNHARRHMNLSEWGSRDPSKAPGRLNRICKEVRSGAMPLSSYLLLHPAARLTEQDIETLCEWTKTEAGRLTQLSRYEGSLSNDSGVLGSTGTSRSSMF